MAGAELDADPRGGRARPNAIAHQQKVATIAEPKANLQMGLVGPNAVAHRKVVIGVVPRTNLQEG